MRQKEKTPITLTNRFGTDRATTGRFAPKASPRGRRPTVTKRRPTAHEARQFDAALGLLLAELVRQELSIAASGVLSHEAHPS